MKNLKTDNILLTASALLLAVGFSSVSAAPVVFKFGVLPDTQWVTPDDGLSPASCPAGEIHQINQQFIARGVKLVIGVGDLTDDSNTAALQTRALYAQELYNAGIAFYPLRGNHEIGDGNDSATDIATLFPQIVNGGNNNTTPINTSSIPTIVTNWGHNSYDSSTAVTAAAFANNPPAPATGTSFQVGTNFSFPSATNVAAANGTAVSGGISYSFDYNNTRFVLLDQFSGTDSNSTQWPNLRSWVDSVINPSNRPLNAFVFAHKNLLGGNHKDNFLGANVDSYDPGDESAAQAASHGDTASVQAAAGLKENYFDQFVSDLYANGVRYFITGHDHHHAHSIVKAPLSYGTTGAYVEQIISQSASNKFYTPSNVTSSNEVSIDEDLYSVGYYIYTVDGPRITVDYYNVPVNGSGANLAVTPTLTGNWIKSLTFGYSKNGQSFSVPEGATYTGITDNTTNAAANATTNGDGAFVGTTLSILSGTNGSTATTHDGRLLTKVVNTGWASAADNGTVSDVATLWGLTGIGSSVNDTIVVQLSFPSGSPSNVILGAQDPNTGTWYNAATLDAVGGTATFVNGPWTPGAALGTYGVDTAHNVAWAVVNGTARSFAVINNTSSIKGDLNGDGVVNAADLALLVHAIQIHATPSTPGYAAYDLNGDGQITAADERWLVQHYTQP